MSELTPEIAAEVVAACEAGAEEAAGALARTLDAETAELAVGEAAAYDPATPPDGFAGPGLAVLMQFGEEGAIAALPEATGLLPDWAPSPDATGESKLSTLAQELSMLLVPETLMADDFKAAWVDDLTAAVLRAGVAEGAGLVPLTLSIGDNKGQLTLVWPASSPAELFPEEASQAEAEASPAAVEDPAMGDWQADPEPARSAPPRPRITELSQLPGYARSLLRVEVPLTVRLASKKQTIDEIVDLGPGAIIMFEKSCDDPVEVTIDDEPIAIGEAVKVGEKFGVRLTEMILPPEQFKALRRGAG